jgi:transposase-like protein
MPAFLDLYGTEPQCEAAVIAARWPQGFVCPHCAGTSHCVLRVRHRPTFQCMACRQQTSIIAGTLFHSTKLALRTWFLALYLLGQAKTNLSALWLMRTLGVSYPTAWLIKHKAMQSMAEREALYTLGGRVEVDDAYLGGQRSGGKVGRGSENKVPFVAAVATTDAGAPLRVKLSPVSGFTSKALADWARCSLSPGARVISDGLACFAAVTEAGCMHQPFVVGQLKPKDLPQFSAVNTTLGNLKTAIAGTYHSFAFSKYAHRYLAEFAYRFNRRFDLAGLTQRLIVAAATTQPRPEHHLRWAEHSC